MRRWRKVPGELNFEVNNLGHVRSVDRIITCLGNGGKLYSRKHKGRILHPSPQPRTGYLEITVDSARYKNGKRVPRRKSVAAMVLETFIGSRPSSRHQVRHLNDVKTDNRLSNLEWGLPVENAADRVRNGNAYKPKGILHHNAKIDENKVRQLRRVYKRYGKEHIILAKKFGITGSTARVICKGIGWSHVQ